MIVTKTKRRSVITTVLINKLERYIPIDLRIPSNAVSITGVLVTTSATWTGCGSLTMQANDRADIFYIAPVTSNSIDASDEAIAGIEEPIVDSDKPWVSGSVPQLKPVEISGDNVYIRAWFKGIVYQEPFTIKVYVEYEAAEELIGIEPEHPHEEEPPKVYIL